jgi:hypothetical protein
VKWFLFKFKFLGLKLFKISLLAPLTAGFLTYSHFHEKPLKVPRQIYWGMSEGQRERAKTYVDRYYFHMSYVQCGLAYDTRGHLNNCKHLILAMGAIRDCERAGVPMNRRLLVSDSTDDFLEDFEAAKDPRSQVCQLGIDPWERFW